MNHLPDDLVWKVAAQQVELRSARLQAHLNLSRPADGLREIFFNGIPLPNQKIMSICSPVSGDGSQRDAVIEDCYVRGNDLVVTYAPHAAEATALQVYWRYHEPWDGSAAIEVILSSQTDSLHAQPTVSICSRVGGDAAWWLASSEPPSFESAPRSAGRWDGPQGEARLGAWLIRNTAAQCSYAEMVYPSDFRCGHIVKQADWLLEYELMRESLEKGVIRRARVCALWISGDTPPASVAHWYHQWVDAPLPLTT